MTPGLRKQPQPDRPEGIVRACPNCLAPACRLIPTINGKTVCLDCNAHGEDSEFYAHAQAVAIAHNRRRA